MKKIATIIASIAMAMVPAVAQYMPTVEGQVLTYKATNYENDSRTDEYPNTVIAVTTGEDGLVTSRVEEVRKVPGNDFAELHNFITYTYNPADGLTTVIMTTPEDTQNEIVNMLVEGAKAQGQFPTEEQIETLRKSIKVKGSLNLLLPADPAPDAKVPNQTMKVSIETVTMSTSIWEVKYLGFEDVEVPAGKFEQALKVSYVVKENTPQENSKSYNTSWYVKNIGEVKCVTTDKKGNVKSELVLTAVK